MKNALLTLNREEYLIHEALESPKYIWRRVKGIADETGIDEKYVEIFMKKLSTKVNLVRINYKGKYVYTTLKHYNKKTNLLMKIINKFTESVEILCA